MPSREFRLGGRRIGRPDIRLRPLKGAVKQVEGFNCLPLSAEASAPSDNGKGGAMSAFGGGSRPTLLLTLRLVPKWGHDLTR